MTLLPNDGLEQDFARFISEVTDLRDKAIEESAKPRIVPSRYDRGHGGTIQPSPLNEPFERLRLRLLNFVGSLSFGQHDEMIREIQSMFSPPDVSTLDKLLGTLRALKEDSVAGRVQLISDLARSSSDTTTLTIFVSSKMKEFAEERQALYALVPKLLQGVVTLHAWVFERDTRASEVPSREIWLEKLETSILYIGLFGTSYGEWTIDEFNKAKHIGLPKLIFIKDIPPEQREQRLADFITQMSDVNSGLTPQYFSTIQDLERHVTDAIKTWIEERLSITSRHKLLEILKKSKEDYYAWFDRNQHLPDEQKNKIEHTSLIRKAVRACENAEDALDDGGKACLSINADSVNWDSCYSKNKNNLTYIAKKRLTPYFVTGHSPSEGPPDKAGAEKMGVYYQRNLDALDDAIDRLKELQ